MSYDYEHMTKRLGTTMLATAETMLLRGDTPSPAVGFVGKQGEIVYVLLRSTTEDSDRVLAVMEACWLGSALEAQGAVWSADAFVGGPEVPPKEDPLARDAILQAVLYRDGRQEVLLVPYHRGDDGKVRFEDHVVPEGATFGGWITAAITSAFTDAGPLPGGITGVARWLEVKGHLVDAKSGALDGFTSSWWSS